MPADEYVRLTSIFDAPKNSESSLFVCQKIIEVNEGKIMFSNNGVQCGSTFQFSMSMDYEADLEASEESFMTNRLPQFEIEDDAFKLKEE